MYLIQNLVKINVTNENLTSVKVRPVQTFALGDFEVGAECCFYRLWSLCRLFIISGFDFYSNDFHVVHIVANVEHIKSK